MKRVGTSRGRTRPLGRSVASPGRRHDRSDVRGSPSRLRPHPPRAGGIPVADGARGRMGQPDLDASPGARGSGGDVDPSAGRAGNGGIDAASAGRPARRSATGTGRTGPASEAERRIGEDGCWKRSGDMVQPVFPFPPRETMTEKRTGCGRLPLIGRGGRVGRPRGRAWRAPPGPPGRPPPGPPAAGPAAGACAAAACSLAACAFRAASRAACTAGSSRATATAADDHVRWRNEGFTRDDPDVLVVDRDRDGAEEVSGTQVLGLGQLVRIDLQLDLGIGGDLERRVAARSRSRRPRSRRAAEPAGSRSPGSARPPAAHHPSAHAALHTSRSARPRCPGSRPIHPALPRIGGLGPSDGDQGIDDRLQRAGQAGQERRHHVPRVGHTEHHHLRRQVLAGLVEVFRRLPALLLGGLERGVGGLRIHREHQEMAVQLDDRMEVRRPELQRRIAGRSQDVRHLARTGADARGSRSNPARRRTSAPDWRTIACGSRRAGHPLHRRPDPHHPGPRRVRQAHRRPPAGPSRPPPSPPSPSPEPPAGD